MDNRNRFFNKVLPFAILYCLLSPSGVFADTAEDLPSPYNLQAAVVNRDVTLSWAWEAPDPGPQFQSFGYEVFRDTGLVAVVSKTAYTDFAVHVGTHTYKVRAKGFAKEMKKKVVHVSAWSEPAGIKILQTCGGPPVVRLTVVPTRSVYGAIHSLRLHFTGDVSVPKGCQLDRVMFHIDSGMSTERAGPLKLDSKGRFDEFIDAMGPEEEPINGNATFNITVTAQDEAGGATSGVYTIDLEKENRFAPKPADRR